MIIFRRAPPAPSPLSKIFLGVCLIGVAWLIWWVISTDPKEPLDAQTRCPMHGQIGHFVLVLIDQSNKFEDADLKRTRATLAKTIGSLDYADKLVAIEPNAKKTHQPIVVFDRCSPKNPASVNAFVDRVQAAQNDSDAFEDAFWRSVEATFARTEAPKSPLLESFVYIAEEPDFIDAERRSIHVYSDLMQHSDVASFYQGIPSVDEIDGRLQAEDLDFLGAQIFLKQVARRDPKESRSKVAAFWNEWLEKHGGKPRKR